MENPGKNNDKSKMNDNVARQLQLAHYQKCHRWAVARNWQYMYESDSDSEDDGLVTPVSLPSPAQNQNQNQDLNPQTTQQQQPSLSHSRTTLPPRKIRPYACRVTKSLRLQGFKRPVVGTWGAEAVALHPRRKDWVTFRDGGRQISMTFERYLREHIPADTFVEPYNGRQWTTIPS